MADPFWRPSTPESRESWLRNLYTPPVIPHPPSVPPEVGGVGDVAGPPVSLHDYPAMAARPLSPNLEDLRFQTPPDLWSRIWSGLGGAPPSHMMPLVQRGLQVLGGGMPGPAPTGSPYPTAPSPYAGTSILSQRLDPSTIMLSNQPPPPAPTPAAEAYATQAPGPTLRGVMPPPSVAPQIDPAYQRAIEGEAAGLTRGDARAAYQDMGRWFKNPDYDPVNDPPGMLGTLRTLMADGWLKVTPDDFDTVIRIPRWQREQMIPVIDQLRPLLLGGQGGYQGRYQGIPGQPGQPITPQEVAERYGGSFPTPEDIARHYGGSVP